jgi:hypothetical protein
VRASSFLLSPSLSRIQRESPSPLCPSQAVHDEGDTAGHSVGLRASLSAGKDCMRTCPHVSRASRAGYPQRPDVDRKQGPRICSVQGVLPAIMVPYDCARVGRRLRRLGTVLGTVGREQLNSWREVLKFLSNFDTVRWLSGRKRRFAKPLYGLKPVPRVRIPASPPVKLF